MLSLFSGLRNLVAPTRADRPRVLLIGTSNALFSNGYAGALRQSGCFSAFHNMSIGLSSSFLFAYQRDLIDFSDFDICILDFCCNDSALIEDGYTDEAMITSQLLDALSTISLSGCIPVIMILPIARCMPTGGLTRKIYRDFCDFYKVPYFDCYNVFDLLNFNRSDKEAVFVDGMHIDKDFAYALGDLIATSIKELHVKRGKRSKQLKYAGFTHRFLSAGECRGPFEIVRRETSLVSAACVDLGPGLASISVGKQEEVVAIVANFAYSHSCVDIRGTNSITVRLSTHHYDPSDRSFIVGIWPTHPPVSELDSTIEIFVQSDGMRGVLCGEGPVVEGPGQASIIGLIMRKPMTLSVKFYFPYAINLSRSLSKAFMAKVPEMRQKALHAAIIDGLYGGLLKRPVDTVGLAHYADVIDVQGLRKGIAKAVTSLMDSDEFKLPG